MESVDTVVLGAGPAGLAAAYRLTRAGLRPVILEKSDGPGGLMRSIRRGDFTVDLGCKELYSRIPEVHSLWSDVLGRDYRPYSHRVGVLFGGRILELSSAYRGFRRGMPWSMFLACGADLLWGWAKPARTPNNYEEYWYRLYGRRFSRAFAQGYREKFRQVAWSEMAAPSEDPQAGASLLGRVKQAVAVGFNRNESPVVWRHPAKGTGQICELLASSVRDAGGRFMFGTRVTNMVASDGRVTTVTAVRGSETFSWSPSHVVASVPLELLSQLVGLESDRSEAADRVQRSDHRSTVIVYLFLDEPPRFPHAWLEVTDPALRAGRITNYAAFSEDMVPAGATSLCVEFFCRLGSDLLRADDDTISTLALTECARYDLLDPDRCVDRLVLKLPGADASTSWRDWRSDDRLRLLSEIKQYRNLFFVGRPGTDRATFAGLRAADAIVAGARGDFDAATDPSLDLSAPRRHSSADFVNARM